MTEVCIAMLATPIVIVSFAPLLIWLLFLREVLKCP